MLIPKGALTRKALLALEEICGGTNGAFERTMALRFVLAYLYAVSKTKSREPFDDLWKGSGFTHPYSKEKAAICCDAALNSQVECIYRSVGIHRSPDFMFYKSRERALREEKRKLIESQYYKP